MRGSKIKYIILLFFVLSTLSRKHTYAQDNTPFADENVDDLGDVSDEFQEAFFEALKQKGIENYDRAIEKLNQCIKLDITSSHPILFFERGKNYFALKDYDAAEKDFIRTLESKPNDRDVLALLYEVYYETRSYDQAETVLKKLIQYDTQYKEDLARLYTSTRRYDEALTLLNELDTEKGQDDFRDTIKNRIYKLSGKVPKIAEQTESVLRSNASEGDYLKLIYLYSEEGNAEKAYEIAKKLEKIKPEADAVQLALYKIELANGNTENAISAMTKVIGSSKIQPKAKLRVLNDFLLFAEENPSYQPQLETAIAYFDKEVGDANIYQKLGEYYLNKKDNTKALGFLEQSILKNPNDINLLKQLLPLELKAGKYDSVIEKSSKALELYPSQPEIYYYLGYAYLKTNKFQDAIDQLEIGADYILDNTQLEANFYEQLGEAYSLLGNAKSARRYTDQARKLRAAN